MATPVPSIQLVEDSIKSIGKSCGKLRIHKDKSKRISMKCQEIMEILSAKSPTLTESQLAQVVGQILPTLQRIQQGIRSLSGYSFIAAKLAHSSQISRELDQYEVDIENATNTMKLSIEQIAAERSKIIQNQSKPLPIKSGLNLPWLGVSVDNYVDLLYHLGRVPPDQRQKEKIFTAKPQLGVSHERLQATLPLKEAQPRLHALIIGINDYVGVQKLRGAVADALAMKEYLEKDLHVPKDRITILLDKEASRQGIIQAFKALKNRSSIQTDDAVLIFYAGHGTEVQGALTLEKGSLGTIQAILPQDFDGRTVHPIPDKTLGSLIGDIQHDKGDNITAIFDCCHSGSVTRNDDESRLAREVLLDKEYFLPPNLDDDIHELSRGLRPAEHVAPGALRTHVLLSACSAREVAREFNGRGQFTTALLALLKTTPVNQITYSDALDRLDSIVGQNPQCEGNNRFRRFFDGKAVPPLRHCYRVVLQDDKYIVKAGSVDGVSMGAEFALYQDKDTISQTSPISTMTVQSVASFDSVLQPLGSSTFQLGKDAVALQTKAGVLEAPKLFVPLDVRLLPVFDALVALRRIPGEINFTLVDDKALASLEIVAVEENKMTMLAFNILDSRVAGHGHRRLSARVPADYKSALRVLSTAAHYYHQLNFTLSHPVIHEKVKVEVKELKIDALGVSPGKSVLQNGIVALEIDNDQSELCYGIRVSNTTNRDLYAYVFYFDNSKLCIDYYHGSSFNNIFKVDPNLPAGEEMTVGFGEGVDPLDFFIPDGQDTDVGFLKFVFTTTAVNLSDVACSSAFEPGETRGETLINRGDDSEIPPNFLDHNALSLHGERGAKKREVQKQDAWGSVLVPIILQRKKRSLKK